MDWDKDYDVKEYHPKKKNPLKKAGTGYLNSTGSIQLPGESALSPGLCPDCGAARESGGVMMTTSEILDFSEGSDSYR